MREKKQAIKLAKKIVSQYQLLDSSSKDAGGYKVDVNKIASNYDITIVEHDFSENMSGVFVRHGAGLFIGVNKSHNNRRKRFTIAHELGHYLLHAEDIVHHDEVDLVKPDVVLYRAQNINGRSEVEANAFAAELLMPEAFVDDCIEKGMCSVEELADTFDVSVDAMRYRLINLGYI